MINWMRKVNLIHRLCETLSPYYFNSNNANVLYVNATGNLNNNNANNANGVRPATSLIWLKGISVMKTY